MILAERDGFSWMSAHRGSTLAGIERAAGLEAVVELTKSLLQGKRTAEAPEADTARRALQFVDGHFQMVASHPPGTPILALGADNTVLGIGFHINPLAGMVPLHETPALKSFAGALTANSEKGASLAALLSTTAEAVPANVYGIADGLREAGDVGTMIFCATKALDPAARQDKALMGVNGLRACIGAADLAAALGHFHGLGTTIQILKILSDGVATIQAFQAKQQAERGVVQPPRR